VLLPPPLTVPVMLEPLRSSRLLVPPVKTMALPPETGVVNNDAIFNNNAGGTVSGLLTNTAGATTNNGQLNGGATVTGRTVTNNNLIAGTVAISGSGDVENNLRGLSHRRPNDRTRRIGRCFRRDDVLRA
jgi:hypothetical protein